MRRLAMMAIGMLALAGGAADARKPRQAPEEKLAERLKTFVAEPYCSSMVAAARPRPVLIPMPVVTDTTVTVAEGRATRNSSRAFA